jgi:AraC-like DNA-binding protein/mannose-6-phosphate isomerase-like protein (cupin superfamily)
MNRLSSLQPFRSFPVSKSEVYLYGAHTAEVDSGWICGKHLHHMMIEINLVLEGEQIIWIDGEEHRMQVGDVALIPPMLMHAYRSDGTLRYFVFHLQIDDPLFFELVINPKRICYEAGHPLNRSIVPDVHRVIDLLLTDSGKIQLFHTIYGIISRIESHYRELQDNRMRDASDWIPLQIAREIESLVSAPRQDEEEPLSGNWLETIAAKLGFSRRHCYRVFHEAYRMSPREYLAILRQQEAMQLLLNDSASVEQIALRIGYDNAQSFIRQFVKWTGLTPGAFRKQKAGEISYLTPLELETSMQD